MVTRRRRLESGKNQHYVRVWNCVLSMSGSSIGITSLPGPECGSSPPPVLLLVFGLRRVCFPPVLVRTARRLLVEALRGVLVSVTGHPRGGAPGP